MQPTRPGNARGRLSDFPAIGHGRKDRFAGTTPIPHLARIFALLALLTGAAVWQIGGWALVIERIGVAVDLLLRVAPLIVGALILAQLLQRLIPQDRLRRWVGAESGWRGLVLATAAGAVTPGGPFAAFPLVLAFQRSGADLGACVAYVTSWSVLGFHRVLIFELPLLGPDFTWLRVLVSLPMPLVAGFAARLIERRLLPAERC
jgi:uncharacterized membrane protein YraQ (UPF0718 family)